MTPDKPKQRRVEDNLAPWRHQAIGPLIRRLREQAGWTQAMLAERSGMAQVVISRLENGQADHAQIRSLRRIAEAFGCNLEVWFSPKIEDIWQC